MENLDHRWPSVIRAMRGNSQPLPGGQNGLSRRAFLASALCAGMFAPPSFAEKRPLWIGYSIVNLWHTIDATKLAALLSNAGCTFTEIEYVPWFNQAAKAGKSIETNVRLAAQFVTEMRAHGITTFISLVNWNGEAQRKQNDLWFQTRFKEIQDHIGADRVMLLPVSEPDGQENGKAYRWTELVFQSWKGIKVGNGDGGRGEPRQKGYDLIDWHHCEDFNQERLKTSLSGRPVINNTDCGPVLNPGPARTRAMARIALANESHFNVYGWDDRVIDEKVIQALAEEIKAHAAGK